MVICPHNYVEKSKLLCVPSWVTRPFPVNFNDRKNGGPRLCALTQKLTLGAEVCGIHFEVCGGVVELHNL